MGRQAGWKEVATGSLTLSKDMALPASEGVVRESGTKLEPVCVAAETIQGSDIYSTCISTSKTEMHTVVQERLERNAY